MCVGLLNEKDEVAVVGAEPKLNEDAAVVLAPNDPKPKKKNTRRKQTIVLKLKSLYFIIKHW